MNTPLKPKEKTNYTVTEECGEEVQVKKEYPASVDTEATWVKKEANCILATRSITLQMKKESYLALQLQQLVRMR